MAEVTILGLGNLLWADEGFGVRAAEKLFEQYADNEKVDVVDGGTQGLALLPWLQQTENAEVLAALDSLEQAMLTQSDPLTGFADLLSRTPELPEHLKK